MKTHNKFVQSHQIDDADIIAWIEYVFPKSGREMHDIIYTVIKNKLTPCQRAYFCEYYVNDCTIVEVAKIFHVHQATVSQALARARKSMHNHVRAVGNVEQYKMFCGSIVGLMRAHREIT